MKKTLLFLSLCLLLSGCGLAAPAGSAPASAGGEVQEAAAAKTPPPADPGVVAQSWERCPRVLANGELYLATGRPSSVNGRCGVMDGRALFAADPENLPDPQDPDAPGVDFQYGAEEGTIEILLDGEWWIYARAGAEFSD